MGLEGLGELQVKLREMSGGTRQAGTLINLKSYRSHCPIALPDESNDKFDRSEILGFGIWTDELYEPVSLDVGYR